MSVTSTISQNSMQSFVQRWCRRIVGVWKMDIKDNVIQETPVKCGDKHKTRHYISAFPKIGCKYVAWKFVLG